jgi:hypothetical protein
MGNTKTPSGWRDEAETYEIRLKGHLDERWAAWFDGLTLIHASDGTTVIRGEVVDQAALHGLLQKVRDLGLPLVSVAHFDRTQPTSPSSTPHDAATPAGESKRTDQKRS